MAAAAVLAYPDDCSAHHHRRPTISAHQPNYIAAHLPDILNMNGTTLTFLIIFATVVIFSPAVVRASNRRLPTTDSVLGNVFHIFAIGCYLGVTPAILAGSLLVGPLRLGIPLSFSLLALAFISLLLHAVFERMATPKQPK